MISYGSVCSGIESASVAWEPLGFTPSWFSEIEPFPCAVLAHRFPAVANLGDMSLLPEAVRWGAIPTPDVLVGGHTLSSVQHCGQTRITNRRTWRTFINLRGLIRCNR